LKLETLDYWYVVISIEHKYIRPGFIQELKVSDKIEKEDTDVVDNQIKMVFNLQSVHQRGVAMRYSMCSDIILSLTEESLLVFEELSDK
jgi:hypothetical protein